MSRTLIKLGCICLLIGASVTTYAPIYSPFPGLEGLVSRSDVIAVATILRQDSFENHFGGYARYTVQIDRVLKGRLTPQRLTLQLRELGIRTPVSKERRQEFERDPFRPLSKHVFFLEKGSVAEEPTAPYHNLNCEGSHFPVSPYPALMKLEGKPLMDSLAILLQEYLDFRRTELQHIEERTQITVGGTTSPSRSTE